MDILPNLLTLGSSLPKALDMEFQEVAQLTQKFISEYLKDYKTKNAGRYADNCFSVDKSLLQELSSRGFLSLWLPKMFGGGGFHPLSMNIFNELMGAECLGTANIVGAHYFAFGLLSLTQNFEVIGKICDSVIEGERQGIVNCLAAAITEPSAGTDREDVDLLKLGKVSCSATKTNSGFVVNGSKIFISNAPWARWFITVTTANTEFPDLGTVVLAIDRNSSGIEFGKNEFKLGQHTSPTSCVYFKNCLVEVKDVAFDRDQFATESEFLQASRLASIDILSMSRSSVGLMAAGAATKSFEMARKYIESINDDQYEWAQAELAKIYGLCWQAKLVSWESSLASHCLGPFKDLLTPIMFWSLKRLPVWSLWPLKKILQQPMMMRNLRRQRLDREQPRTSAMISSLSSMAKSSASDLASEAAQRSIQLIGMTSFKVDRVDLYRLLSDLKLLQIYEGTNEMNRIQAYPYLSQKNDFRPYSEVNRNGANHAN